MNGPEPHDDSGELAVPPVVIRQLLGVRIFLVVVGVGFTIVALGQVADQRSILSVLGAMVVIAISYGAILSALRERVEIDGNGVVRVVRLFGAEEVAAADIKAVRRRGGGRNKSPHLELSDNRKADKGSRARPQRSMPSPPRPGGVLRLPTINYQQLADALGVDYLSGREDE